MSIADPDDRARPIGSCVTCGRPITYPSPDGECLRCLLGAGFHSDADQRDTAAGFGLVRPGALRYAEFEVDLDTDGFPAVLGAGAMAITYRARDTILNSAVALKVIGRKLAEEPVARARFLREARAAAQIRHPNVARVIHYGEQDGECFYAMELVEGETLEGRVQRDGPLPLATALEIVEQTARGLAAGEACGVIHRDLKPSNLMIESDPGGGFLVKIIDYGVAKVMAGDNVTVQTQAGFIGTPAFASPEQFDEGGKQQVDTRSDVYSLGTTFWYLLTGRGPFTGTSIGEIRTKQMQQLPLGQLKAAHVPAQVIALLTSMLNVDASKRPQTAKELLTAVHGCRTRFEPAARRRRKRLVIAAGALVMILALGSVAALLYQRAQSSSELNKSIAVLPFENLSASADDHFFTLGIQDQILTRLATLADLKVISRTSTQKYQSKPADLKAVGRELGVGRVLEGSVQRAADTVRVNVQLIDVRADTHLWAKTYDRPIANSFAIESEVADAVAQQLSGDSSRKISAQRPTQNVAAYDAYLRGVEIQQRDASGKSRTDAAAAFTEAVQLDPNFALAWARLALVRSFLYNNGIDRNANSPTTIKEAVDRAIALQPDLGEAWIAQGQYKTVVLGDRIGALQGYREAEKYLPNSSLIYEYMVYSEARLGRWAEAEAHFWRATELDPRNLRLWTITATQIFRQLRRFPEAHAAVDRALEISPNNELALTTKAELYQCEGRIAEAHRELALVPQDSTDTYVLNLRAWQATLEHNFDQAIFWYEKQTKAIKPGQPLSVSNLRAFAYLGYCQEWAGHADEARASFQRVLQETSPNPGVMAAPGREIHSYVGLAYAGLGDRENALEQARQAVADAGDDTVQKPIAEDYLAYVQAELGDIDSAIAAVSQLLEVPHGITAAEARYTPFWDPLRKDPRFQALLNNPSPTRY